MTTFNYKNPAVLTAREARELGVQINDTPETAIGMTKAKRDKTQKVHVMPADFVIDRFNYTTLDPSHVDYKKVIH